MLLNGRYKNVSRINFNALLVSVLGRNGKKISFLSNFLIFKNGPDSLQVCKNAVSVLEIHPFFYFASYSVSPLAKY